MRGRQLLRTLRTPCYERSACETMSAHQERTQPASFSFLFFRRTPRGTFARHVYIATEQSPHRMNPFRTAVPFWGQTTQISSSLSPKQDCGSEGVKIPLAWPSVCLHTYYMPGIYIHARVQDIFRNIYTRFQDIFRVHPDVGVTQDKIP